MKKAVIKILQSSVVTQTVCGVPTILSALPSSLTHLHRGKVALEPLLQICHSANCVKNYESWLAVDKVIAIIKSVILMTHSHWLAGATLIAGFLNFQQLDTVSPWPCITACLFAS